MGDQVDPQAQEVLHNSSTDSCPTFPYSSNSPRPFPPSPVHYVSVSPEGVSPLPIATNNPPTDNVVIHSATVHAPPIPIPTTVPISRSFQTHPSILLSPITSSYNAPLHPPYLPRFFPPVGPSIFAGISSIPPYLGPSFPNTVSIPSQPLPPMTTLRSIPGPFSSTGPQSSFGPRPSRRSIRIPRGMPPGRRRAPRGRRSKITSLPAAKPLPFPATFGLIFNPVGSPLEVPLLMVP